MDVKLFILTYDNESWLNQTLDSLSKSDFDGKTYIINNHSHFSVAPEYDAKVLHNVLRLDRSTGHISRSWNQAIMNGFVNLNDPECDIVMVAQDDTIFAPNLMERIKELVDKGFTFAADGWGDNFMFWTPDGIKQIGLWDERFVFGGCSCEYFLRALMYNKNHSFINDRHHTRFLNAEGYPEVWLAGRPEHKKEHVVERKFNKGHDVCMLQRKFPTMVDRLHAYTAVNWTPKDIREPPREPACESYVYYPYFEKDIKTLRRQKYVGY